MYKFLSIALLTPTAAFAQAVETAQPSGAQQFASVLPLIAIAAVMYFLLIRPQSRRMKEHQTMLGALKKGDEVITGGGIAGKITKVDDGDMATVEIAPSIEVRVLKSTISTVLGKDAAKSATPANANKKSAGKNKNDNTLPGKNQIANDN